MSKGGCLPTDATTPAHEKKENPVRIPGRSANAGLGTDRDATVARKAGACVRVYLVVRGEGAQLMVFLLRTVQLFPR